MAAVKIFSSGAFGSRANPIGERTSAPYRASLTDADGVDVQPAQIDAIYLSLRDVRSDAIVNSRDAVAVKDANGGTLSVGAFEMQFDEDDMVAVGSETLQPRRLTLDIRLVGGGRVTHEVAFWIRAMEDIDD